MFLVRHSSVKLEINFKRLHKKKNDTFENVVHCLQNTSTPAEMHKKVTDYYYPNTWGSRRYFIVSNSIKNKVMIPIR